MNSRLAPPPVEMWLIRAATPASFTARTESPPPTSEYALDPAIARATAVVPAAKLGHSNTPIGPFQKIVFAPANFAA